MRLVMPAPVAEEHVAHLAHHVERGQQRAKHQQVIRSLNGPRVRRFQNAVLRPEAGEDQRKSAQRQHADGVGGEGQRHARAQPTHVANVLLLVRRRESPSPRPGRAAI